MVRHRGVKTCAMRRRMPHRAAAGLVAGAVACAVTAALALASCAQSAPIQIPSADAAPEKVVQTLIAAINARDADAVRAVGTPSFADQVIDTWFGVTFEDVSIDAPPDVAEADTEVYVHIDAVLHGTDGSLPNGELVGWGYGLARQEGGSRWLVSDQGVG